MMETFEYTEHVHGDTPDAAIIWLHGLGADGYDFKPIVKQLALPRELSAHFVFPHAPVQAVTINQGMQTRAWYDIYALSMAAEEDEVGIQSSMQALELLIKDKFQHIPPSRVLLAGFSQGGALALHTLLHGSLPIGGIIALSTYLPLRDSYIYANKQRVIDCEVFLAHGEHDQVLPLQMGVLARDILLTLGAKVSWHSYPMAHELCVPQIEHMREWIIQRLS